MIFATPRKRLAPEGFINGEPKEQPILASTTGGWFPNHQRWHTEGLFDLSKGTVLLRIESEPLMSHVDQLRLTPIKDVPLMTKLIEEMRLIESELKTLEENAPEPQMVMAAAEGEVADTKLHRRGDHNNLGRPIPRGALSTIGPEMAPLQDQERVEDWSSQTGSLMFNIPWPHVSSSIDYGVAFR